MEVLRPFGIVEMVRTGQVVMTRGLEQQTPEAVSQAPANESPTQPEQNAPASTDRPGILAHVEETSHSV